MPSQQGLIKECTRAVLHGHLHHLVQKETTDIVENPESRKDTRPPRYTMTWDVRQEFRGSYSAYKEKQDMAGRDQSYDSSHAVDPNTHGMKWMKERQCSYRDIQLEFWLLLRPLTDRSEERTHQLARRLLSVWQWSSAVEPTTYPPVPTSLDIGYWLHQTRKNNNRQFWIEAYACALQRVAEASIGRRWIAFEGKESTQDRESSRGVPTCYRDQCTPGENSSVLAPRGIRRYRRRA